MQSVEQARETENRSKKQVRTLPRWSRSTSPERWKLITTLELKPPPDLENRKMVGSRMKRRIQGVMRGRQKREGTFDACTTSRHTPSDKTTRRANEYQPFVTSIATSTRGTGDFSPARPTASAMNRCPLPTTSPLTSPVSAHSS